MILEVADQSGYEATRGQFAFGVMDARTRTRDQIINKALSMAMGGDSPGSQAYLAGVDWYNDVWLPSNGIKPRKPAKRRRNGGGLIG